MIKEMKMKILSLITHPHFVPNPSDLCSSSEQKLRCFWWNTRSFWPGKDSSRTTTFKFKFKSSCITVWYGNCCAADRKTLQRTVNTAAKIIGAPLPSILDIFLTRCSSKAKSIVEDPTHPSHSLFQLLPSGRRYRSIRARSARLLNSFFPQAVRALNSHHTAPLWNPKQPPPPPPHPTTSQEKTVKLLSLWNSGERACTSHL